MKDLNREQTAFELFKIMNANRSWASSVENNWDWMKSMGFHKGYLRLADYMMMEKSK